MSTFVNSENTKERPDGKYGEVIQNIAKDGVCPFCAENLPKYHKNPILKEGKFWLLTRNMYPYEGATFHMLIVHKKHIVSFAEVSPDAWTEIKSLVDEFVKENNIPGGTLVMRFGDNAYTGASVSHLHANFISSEGKKDGKPIIARVG